MCGGEWSILIHELLHRFGIGDPFVAVRNAREQGSVWCSGLFLDFLLNNFFLLFGNKDIFDQLSILFPLFKLPLPPGLSILLFFFLFEVLFFYLF
jgi:hypothetical protein